MNVRYGLSGGAFVLRGGLAPGTSQESGLRPLSLSILFRYSIPPGKIGQ